VPKITIDISDDFHERLETIAKSSGATKEELILDGLEALLDHFDEMFSEIKKLMLENPTLSMEEIEEKVREKFDVEDEEDHIHTGKGCCSVKH
jgi:hypothetical protein